MSAYSQMVDALPEGPIKVLLVADRLVYRAGIDVVRADSGAWDIRKDGTVTIRPELVAVPLPTVCGSCGATKNHDGSLPCDH
ncbi:hypothetical protein [Pandoraea sputorum]|uniref:hypothetical protein n=1 Tax=Pandoraea sputorum TaxID=93222 RepID=UPI002F910032